MTLTVEYKDETITIICDQEGLERLGLELNRVDAHTPPWHTHLMTAAWGGGELTEDRSTEGSVLVQHVRIQLIPS